MKPTNIKQWFQTVHLEDKKKAKNIFEHYESEAEYNRDIPKNKPNDERNFLFHSTEISRNRHMQLEKV